MKGEISISGRPGRWTVKARETIQGLSQWRRKEYRHTWRMLAIVEAWMAEGFTLNAQAVQIVERERGRK